VAARTSLLLGIALAAAGMGSCLSYQRELGEDEPRRRPSAPPPAPIANAGSLDTIPPPPPAIAAQADVQPTLVEAFPGVRVDARYGIVEFDATISPLIFEPYEGRNFYLEEFVCKRGTKDHESLVVTDAQPAHIHAALLLLGIEPGSPVTWTKADGIPQAHPATGPAIGVEFLLPQPGGEHLTIEPQDWTKKKGSGQRFPSGNWVFAGSAMAGPPDARFYEADAAGTIVGLASFGTEVISWGSPISPEEAEGQLEWIADLEAMPAADSPLIVRLHALDR